MIKKFYFYLPFVFLVFSSTLLVDKFHYVKFIYKPVVIKNTEYFLLQPFGSQLPKGGLKKYKIFFLTTGL